MALTPDDDSGRVADRAAALLDRSSEGVPRKDEVDYTWKLKALGQWLCYQPMASCQGQLISWNPKLENQFRFVFYCLTETIDQYLIFTHAVVENICRMYGNYNRKQLDKIRKVKTRHS